MPVCLAELACAPRIALGSGCRRVSHSHATVIRAPTVTAIAAAPRHHVRRGRLDVVRADPEDAPSTSGAPAPDPLPTGLLGTFGFTRKDALLLGVYLIALGYALRWGAVTVLGIDELTAGVWVQMIVFLGLCGGWVSTYLYRVASKQMTYVKQARPCALSRHPRCLPLESCSSCACSTTLRPPRRSLRIMRRPSC